MIEFEDGFATESGEVQAHHYDPATGAYTRTGAVYVSTGCGLPFGATIAALPVAPGGYWPQWTGTDWELVEDHRGQVYRTDNGEALQHELLGALPEGLTILARPSAAHHWQAGAWVVDLAGVHVLKTDAINRGCTAAITGGFWSSALEQPHQYASELDDQLNLTGVILRGFDSPYACRDELGTKAYRPHSFAQLRQVGDDFTVFKLQLLQKANELKQRLDQALVDGDLSAMESIAWEGAQ